MLLRQLMDLAGPAAAGAEVGPGDDAAAWRLSGGCLGLWSTDSMVEDIDFRRRYQTPYQVGWKAWVGAASDLAAMGANPRGGLVAAAFPGDTPAPAVEAIQLGLVDAAAADGAFVLGGDLSRTDGPLVLTVTVLGELSEGSPVLLRGGSVEDALVVTGSLGLAAAALEVLEQGSGEVPLPWNERFLQPRSRTLAGVALRRAGASAMTDISDGFLRDLGRLCEASGVGAEVWLDCLPVAAGPRSEVSETLALTGGEDFELLAAIPDHLVGQLNASWSQGLPPLSRLGVLTEEKGIRLLKGQGGEPIDLPDGDGFQHF
ncbi:MAG: thiamine-phosphate kinase [Candidatus Dormiibacterota bacterium]